jgi:hypothetical protein
VYMPSELISRPSTSKMHARTGGKFVTDIAHLCSNLGLEARDRRFGAKYRAYCGVHSHVREFGI